MLRAPASALWPSATATLPPVTQASGWRSQNPRMSDTAALASVTACLGSILASGDEDCIPLGSKTQTTPNQKAIRNKKNMTSTRRPRRCSAAFEQTIADRLEAVVLNEKRFLSKIDENARRIFIKFDRIKFA
jgi:hypothetical protein